MTLSSESRGEAEKPIVTGTFGKLSGWRINGKSYDPDGNEIEEIHEAGCFCCRDFCCRDALLVDRG